ncbi:MAG: hypothetical protein AAGB35_10000, partial [Pseudomonadota bacterium]
IQKHLIKGTHEYEIDDDQIHVSINSRFKEKESLSITLAVLNPEPIITKSHLDFVSRVNGEPLLSLSLSKPNVVEFNEFVNIIKQRAEAEYNAISGIKVTANTTSDRGDEEPPEFDDVSHEDIIKTKNVNIEGLENAINMLEIYVNHDEVQPLIVALESLKQAPQDHARLVKVATAFNELGPSQGAVLTYAPYISIMLSDDPF